MKHNDGIVWIQSLMLNIIKFILNDILNTLLWILRYKIKSIEAMDNKCCIQKYRQCNLMDSFNSWSSFFNFQHAIFNGKNSAAQSLNYQISHRCEFYVVSNLKQLQ